MSRTWTCRRQSKGVLCLGWNSPGSRKCAKCGKPRPARSRPAHMRALDVPYEEYVVVNGGEACGICGAQGKTRRLHRDHDHRTGEPRGLLCFRDNSALRPYMTVEWLRAAVAYLERTV